MFLFGNVLAKDHPKFSLIRVGRETLPNLLRRESGSRLLVACPGLVCDMLYFDHASFLRFSAVIEDNEIVVVIR
jgi:hypothetical protein